MIFKKTWEIPLTTRNERNSFIQKVCMEESINEFAVTRTLEESCHSESLFRKKTHKFRLFAKILKSTALEKSKSLNQ